MLGQLGGEERLPVTLERRNEHYGGTRTLNVDTTHGGRISAPLLLWKYNEHNAGGKRAWGGRGRRERRAGIKKDRKKAANGTRR